MKGSDTLFEVTNDVIATCLDKVSGANVPLNINYIGGGSGGGESAMAVNNPAQKIAPMSRFLQAGACNPLDAAASNRKAEGVNFALDGLSIVSSKSTGASAACNGTPDCNRATDPGAGFATNRTVTITMNKIVPGPNGSIEETAVAGDDVYEGSVDTQGAEGILPGANGVLDTNLAANGIGGVNDDRIITKTFVYTFGDWKDVLRVLLAGKFTHGWTENGGAVATPTAAKDCDNDMRHALADNYAKIFQTDCTTGNCAKVHHIFRRDDISGTTDTVIDLLGLTKAVSIDKSGYFSPFCNGFSQTATNTGAPPCDFRKDPTQSVGFNAAYDWDQQDWDPIRRHCAQDEKVCGRNGTLGMVLPMLPTDFMASDTAFPTAQVSNDPSDATGHTPLLLLRKVPAPNIYLIGANDQSVTKARCPQGNTPSSANQCQNVLSDRDKNDVAVTPALLGNLNPPGNKIGAGLQNANFCGYKGTQADGRVYNLTLRAETGAIINDVRQLTATALGPRPIVGAYYRIHQVAGSYDNYGFDPSGVRLTTPLVPQCVDQDATRQIGCLASVDACSFGYAGLGALDAAPTLIDAVQQDTLYPDKACVQKLITDKPNSYPIARKLFYNTLFGFSAVNTDELALVQCASNQTYIKGVVNGRGFIEMPTAPVCADLDETSRCSATAPNVNHCSDNSGIALDTRVTTNGAVIPSNTDTVIP
jgi:hypothetical protein